MNKLTKFIFAGLLAIGIAPAVFSSFSQLKEPVHVKADGLTATVYNVWSLKEYIEDPNYSKITLSDEVMKLPDVDPRPEIIIEAPNSYSVGSYITITHDVELVLQGDCIFEQGALTYGKMTFNTFIDVLGAKLTISGAGTLGFKASAAPSVSNTVIRVNTGGEVEVNSSAVTIRGDVKTKTSTSAIFVSSRGILRMLGGKVTSVHASPEHANQINNYTVYTTYDPDHSGLSTVFLENNVEIDFEKTSADVNSVLGLAWAYPERSQGTIKECTINAVGEDLGASFAGNLHNSSFKIYDANGNITTNYQQKISVREPGHNIVKQPVGGAAKIGQRYKYNYTLDFTPENVRLQRFKIEAYDIDQIGQSYAWVGFGSQEDWDAKEITPNINHANPLRDKQYFRLMITYIGGDTAQYTLYSNVFMVNYAPYNVRFDANGGSGSMAATTYEGSTFTLPQCGFTAPLNKAFDHWEINGEMYKPLYDAHVSGDIVVKAIWKTLDWNFTIQPVNRVVPVGEGAAITFDGNFADDSEVELLKQVGSEWQQVWKDNVQDSHSNIIPLQSAAIKITYRLDVYSGTTLKKSSDEFYVSWVNDLDIQEYTISFDAGEGSGTMDSITAPEEEEILLPQSTFTAPDDKVFVGWALDDSSASYVDYEAGEAFEIDNAHTFYAVYDDGYTVQFDANGGSGVMGNVEHVYGPYELPECMFEPAEGTRFVGWSVNDSVTTYYPGDVVDVYGDTGVTPVWDDITYNVYYEANGGSGTMAPSLDQPVSNFSVPVCTFTAPSEHYQFSHWAIDSAAGEALNEESVITLEGNMILYAVWELKTYSVSYVAGEASSIAGNGAINLGQVEALTSLTIQSSIAFEAPQGKHFKEWRVNSETGAIVKPGAKFELTANTTFIAMWEADATDEGLVDATVFHKVSFNANGGSGNMEALDVQEGAYVLPACTFTAPEGKAFDAWEVNGERKTVGDSIQVTADVTVKALWKDAAPGTSSETSEPGSEPTSSQPSSSEVGPVNPTPAKKGLPAGAVVGIVIGSVLVVGIGGFALVWFVIKKKTWADFIALFKKK